MSFKNGAQGEIRTHGFQDLQSRALGRSATCACVNTCMQTYDVTTPDGLQIHLSISKWDTGYIFINDIYDNKMTFKYFTDMRTAIYFIKSFLN